MLNWPKTSWEMKIWNKRRYYRDWLGLFSWPALLSYQEKNKSSYAKKVLITVFRVRKNSKFLPPSHWLPHLGQRALLGCHHMIKKLEQNWRPGLEERDILLELVQPDLKGDFGFASLRQNSKQNSDRSFIFKFVQSTWIILYPPLNFLTKQSFLFSNISLSPSLERSAPDYLSLTSLFQITLFFKNFRNFDLSASRIAIPLFCNRIWGSIEWR